MSSHLRAEDHPTTRVIPEPSQRSRAGRLPPPRGDPAAEHYSRPIFWRETSWGEPSAVPPAPGTFESAEHILRLKRQLYDQNRSGAVI